MAAAAAEDPELAKQARMILKKLGYPAQEVASSPNASLTRVQTCLVRRMAVFDSYISDTNDNLKDLKTKNRPTATLEKSLS